MKRLLFSLFCLVVLSSLLLPGVVWAQGEAEQVETPPATEEGGAAQTHVIQEGESLFSIAILYGTTVEALQLINNIADPGLIFAGQELIIPGAVSGAAGESIFTTHLVQFGDTLPGLAQGYATTPAEIAAANRLVRPDSLFVGQNLVIVSYSGSSAPLSMTGRPHIVQAGETLLTIAALYGVSPAELADANGLAVLTPIFPGTRLRVPAGSPYHNLPPDWQTLQVRPAPWTQGDAISIYLETDTLNEPQGRLGEQPLRFAPYEAGYLALVGIDAFTEPGHYPLEIETTNELGERASFQQQVAIQSAGYVSQTITLPDSMAPLLEPAVRANEDAFLATFFNEFTPIRYWEGVWQRPVSTTVVTAGYGGARSYNGGPFSIYHTGIDFSGVTGTPIVAPANGIVTFSGPLELRGNSVLINHGLGVVSGYYHLDRIVVAVGEAVVPGQVIGYGGSTGLSTGPHLHWEVRIFDVPVNGEQWLREPIP